MATPGWHSTIAKIRPGKASQTRRELPANSFSKVKYSLMTADTVERWERRGHKSSGVSTDNRNGLVLDWLPAESVVASCCGRESQLTQAMKFRVVFIRACPVVSDDTGSATQTSTGIGRETREVSGPITRNTRSVLKTKVSRIGTLTHAADNRRIGGTV